MTTPNPTVDAADLGRALDLDPAAVQTLMRAGTITSLFETGEGDHAGTFRLTFRYKVTRVRYTCDAQGNVLKTSRMIAAPKA